MPTPAPAATLSANGEEQLAEAVNAERLRGMNITQYCLVGCVGLALATAGFAAFVPASGLMAFYAASAAASLFPITRGAVEFLNAGKLANDPVGLVDKLLSRPAKSWKFTSNLELMGVGAGLLLTPGLGILAFSGLLQAPLTALLWAGVSASFGLSLGTKAARDSIASHARGMDKLHDKLKDILDQEAKNPPVGSGNKLGAAAFPAASSAPGFNNAAEVSASVETEKRITISRPLQLKQSRPT